MKLHTLTFAALIALSATASADWMDGMTNSAGNANAAGTTQMQTKGNGNGAAKGATKANGWGTGKGDADGEINFSITFKGKARTNMDTKMAADGEGDSTANGLVDWVGDRATSGSTGMDITGSNNSKGLMSAPLTHYVPASPAMPYATATTQVPAQ